MKKTFNLYFNMLLSSMLVLLGFSSCSNKDDIYPLEYGSPSADYIFKGTVTDEDNHPIEGIKVIAEYDSYNADSSTLTNTDGAYLKLIKRAYPTNKVLLHFKDIDGEKNGAFQDTTVITNDLVKTKERDGWYVGEYTITVNQKLKKK